MSAERGRPVRVLIVHQGLLRRVDEGGEVFEQLAGLVEADREARRLEILATDCQRVYAPHLDGGLLELEPAGSLGALLRRGVDVAHVHLAVPQRQLVLAAALRLRGAAVVFSPMVFLTRNFALASLSRGRRRWWLRFKPLALRALRWMWCRVADRFACVSAEEMVRADLPPQRCAIAPWPRPGSALGEALAAEPATSHRTADGPVAFVSRWDPWRKGVDQMVRWLQDYAEVLPRPAVLMLTPKPARLPAALSQLIEAGVVEWDEHTRGAALLGRLRQCRGMILLSRFEGQPRALREAACLGLPTLSTPASNFSEVVALLDSGAVVDARDPQAVHRGFVALGRQPDADAQRARRLLDRAAIGAFLADLLVAAAEGSPLREPNYYDRAARWLDVLNEAR